LVKSVNVVNVEESIKESYGQAVISSTAEIEQFLDELHDKDIERWDRLQSECHIYEKAINLYGLSRDIILRIALSEDLLGISIPVAMIEGWRIGAVVAAQDGKVKDAWIAFANTVKRFYEKCGVKWTKCRPNKIREMDNKLKVLKQLKPGKLMTGQELANGQNHMQVLSGLVVKTPSGEESAAAFLSLKECDNMERYVKGKHNQKGGQNHG
jgi:hypothetical protein